MKKATADQLSEEGVDLGEKSNHSIPEVYDKHWEAFISLKNQHDLTWTDVFSRFYTYRAGLDYIFGAPPDLTKGMQLDLNTAMALSTQWLDAIRQNWDLVHKHGAITKFLDTDLKNRPVIAVGAGPSLKLRGSVKQIAESKFQQCGGIVIATMSGLKPCLEGGVIPDFAICMDASDLEFPYIDHPLVEKHAKDITLLGGCSMSPKVLRNWKGDKMGFVSGAVDMYLIPNLDMFLTTLLPEFPVIESGGNTDTSAITIMACLDVNPIALVGMDRGYPKGFPHDQTMYYQAYLQSVGKDYKDAQDMISKCYTDYHHPVFGTDFYYDFVFDIFRTSLFTIAKAYHEKFGYKLINCTEGGTLHSEDIESMPLQKFLAMVESGEYKNLQHLE